MRLFAGIWPPPDAVAELTQLERPELVGVRWVTPAQWHVTIRFFGEVDGADVGGLIERLSSVAARFREGPPIQASLGPRVGRLGPRILAVEVGGLAELAEAIRLATSPLGNSRPHEAGDPGEVNPGDPGGADGGAPGAAAEEVEAGPAVEAVQVGSPGAAQGGGGSTVGATRPVPRPGGAPDRTSDPDVEQPFLGHLTLARCRRGAKVAEVVGQPVSAGWAVQDLALIASELGPGGSRYHDVIRLPLGPQHPKR